MSELNERFKVVVIDELKGKGLVAAKEINDSEIIFEEAPIVCSQFEWNKEFGYSACDHCLRPLESAEENARRLSGRSDLVLPYSDFDNEKPDIQTCPSCGVKYCSEQCRVDAFNQYHQTLCIQKLEKTEYPEHPVEILIDEWKKIHYPPEECSIMLLARIVAHVSNSSNPTETIAKYMQFCHKAENDHNQLIHKLLGDRFSSQLEHIRAVFLSTINVDKVQPWFTTEGFRTLFALIGTNSQGIGTNPLTKWYNKVNAHLQENSDRVEFEKWVDELYASLETKTGLDFLDNEGSGLYVMQSCINHSCDPNAEVVFLNSCSKLSLRAKRVIQPGEEICISYINECMIEKGFKTRQRYLQENYLFKCVCGLCVEQALKDDGEEEEEEDEFDDEDEDMDEN